MAGTATIYGTPYSTYVRTVRMALEEKGAPYELVDVSVLGGEQKQPAHLARNPFGTVPAFEHDGLKLYETSAVARYVDQVFPGPQLTPEDPAERACMNQIISVIDYHGYRSIILQVVAPRLFTPLLPAGADGEAIVEAGLPTAELCLREFERMMDATLMGADPFLAGGRLSLADLYLVPVVHYLTLTPDKHLLDRHAGLTRWWRAMGERPSVAGTVPRLG
jgi:glutathione S-transferase